MQTCIVSRACPAGYAVDRCRSHKRLSGWTLALPLALAFAAWPAAGRAQVTRTLTACTSASFTACAELRLTATPDAFELALRTIGDTADAARPVAFYNLVLGTGAPAVGPRSTLLAPTPAGGAVARDGAEWEVFDTGDALFLSALSNRGVGGCAVGADVGDFGQAVTTCGTGQFAVFRFTPTGGFDPGTFSILNLEAVALVPNLPAASCGAPDTRCVITADTGTPGVVPEPVSVALVGAGLLGVGGIARRRRLS